MALPSSFRERLELMERTRNQRLSLLEAEKELQARKSEILSSKLKSVRSRERNCLLLETEIAAQKYKVAALSSQIQSLENKYQAYARDLRVLKAEVERLETGMKEKEAYYEVKCDEMKAFREEVKKFVRERQREVSELRNRVNELKSIFINLQGSDGFLSNSEIAVAEMNKSKLLAMKDNLNKTLACNYEIRSQLQKQLQEMFTCSEVQSPIVYFKSS